MFKILIVAPCVALLTVIAVAPLIPDLGMAQVVGSLSAGLMILAGVIHSS